MKLTIPMNIQKNTREKEPEITCGKTRTFSLNSALIALFTCVVLITGGMLPERASALYSYGNYDSNAYNTVRGDAYTAYYLAMRTPDMDNVRIVGFWHRGFSITYLRAAIYNQAGELLSDSGHQVHIGLIDGGSEWQEFSFSQPVDFPTRNTPFGYAVKFEHTNGTMSGFFLYTTDGAGQAGDCDQSYKFTDYLSLTSTTPFPSTLVSIAPRINNTVYYKVAYALYPTISSVSPGYLNDGQADILIEGAGFEGKDEFGAGTSKVWLTENSDWAIPGVKVQQTDSTWSNNAIIFSASFGALIPGTTAYLWVENSDGQVNDTGTPVQLNIPCPNPPVEVPGTLLITPDDGSYVPGTFTISDEFTAVETVYGCVYTLDDGTLWKPGVVSGTGTYTCTASDIAATDATSLSIRMKATSCGGTSAPGSLLSRIVDAQGPVSTFTAAPGDTQCTLTWPSSDAGSGLHTTEPFELRWGTTALATCLSGTQLYMGIGTSTVHTGLLNGSTYYYRLCKKDNFGNTSFDTLTCTLDASPWNILNDGTAPGNGYATGSSTNNPVSAFTLEITNGGGSDVDTVTELRVTGTNTANINTARIYLDNGTDANTYDSGDTFIASVSFSGDTAAFTGLNIPVTETASQYIITYDIIASPTDGETLTAFVSSASAQAYSVTNNDTVDATITLDTIVPTTTDDLNSSSWQGSEITITLSTNDGSGSGVDTITDLYGCLGAACTPTVLGGTSMTTDCGAGNTCEYAVRYYSVDRAGNIEPVKTGTSLARIDRIAPSGGTFTAIQGSNPIVLQWSNFTDVDSGISSYQVRRASGTTPPADCLSGVQRYSGNDSSFTDNSGIVSGQQYSYRLCVYDVAGNVLSNNIATVTAGDSCLTNIMCDSCHGPESSFRGGSRIAPPRGHALHGPDCSMCHRVGADPAHVDGIVTIAFESGYQGGDSPWPGGGWGMSCGGTFSPVGGDPGGGPMGCHAGGTPNYPGLTPEWECLWDEFPSCNSPP